MYLQYVIVIYCLTLFKISFGIVKNIGIILSLMAMTRYLTNDKAIFTKQIIKLRRMMYGYNTITK